MKILTTTNYTQFKKVTGNRPVNLHHVNYLIKLNSEINEMWQYPGKISKNGYLLDGQHRIKACEAQGWPFPYIVTEKDYIPGKNDVAILNTAQLGWRILNYIHFYADNGNEQYQFLEHLMSEYQLKHPNILGLFSGNHWNKAIKNGTFVLFKSPEEKELMEDMVKAYVSLRGKVKNIVFYHSCFPKALRTVFKKFSAEDLIVALDKGGVALQPQRFVRDYLRNLEAIFNYHRQEKNHVRFF